MAYSGIFVFWHILAYYGIVNPKSKPSIVRRPMSTVAALGPMLPSSCAASAECRATQALGFTGLGFRVVRV